MESNREESIIAEKIFQKRNNWFVNLWNTENVFQTPLTFYETLLINPFLNPRILANHIKVEGLYKGDCFSIVKYLLLSNTNFNKVVSEWIVVI